MFAVNRFLLAVAAAFGVALTLAIWRIDHVTTDRDKAQAAADQQQARADSLRNTLSLTRELANEQAQAAASYQTEVKNGRDEAERLRRCIADGTCGLRVSATCVRVDGADSAGSGADAGAPRLTASAEQDYSALYEGLGQQRAQIIGLQQQLRNLHGRCKIGGGAAK